MRLPDAFAGTPKQPWPARQPQLRRQAAGNLGGGIKTTPQYSGPAGRHGNQNHTLGQGGTCRDHSIGQHSGKNAGADEEPPDLKLQSEERRVGEEGGRTCGSRWSPDQEKKK